MIWSSQHGFIKEKLGLTSLIGFCGEVTGMVDEERVVDVVYLNFSKAFDTVSSNVLIDTGEV